MPTGRLRSLDVDDRTFTLADLRLFGERIPEHSIDNHFEEE